MPLGFDPADYVDVPLDCVDEGKPESERAKFRLRFITAGELKKVTRLREAAWKASCADDNLTADRLVNESIRIGVIGWENLRGADGKIIPYAPAPEIPPSPPIAKDEKGKVIAQEPSEPPYDVLDEFALRLKFAIAAAYPWNLLVTDSEKKASPSQSPGATAGSVGDAPAANVQTNPA